MWRRAWIWGSPLTSKPGALKGLAVFWRGSAEVNENQAPAADPSEVKLTLFNTPHPLFSLCTHSLLPALTKRRRKTRKFNNAFERQDYLRRRLRCYAASEISCALLSFCSHHIPPSFPFTLLFPLLPSLAKDSPQKHIKTLLWCHGSQLTPRVQIYRLLGMWHILDGWGGKCACACSGECGIGVVGCIVCLL